MPNVLIISYYWPPAGGPGVQRLLKFAKYLPQFGWNPIILTVKNGNFPALDHSLVKDIPPGTKTIKTANYEPDILYKKLTGTKKDSIPVAVLAQDNLNWKKKIAHWIRLNLFVPDAKIGWINPALKAVDNLLKQTDIDLVFSSSPPPTTHLIAQKIHLKYKIKWIADFRDPWTNIHYYRNAKRLTITQNKDIALEKKVINDCDAITTASRMFQNLLPLPPDKNCLTITNGFDDEVDLVPKLNFTKFTIVHMGSISANRYYRQFFNGLYDFLKDPQIRKNTQLMLIGKVNSEILNKIKQQIPADILNICGYLPHKDALSNMKSAALNLIFLEKISDYKGHIPGKIFEYLAVKRPIIGAGDPAGDTAMIIKNSGCGMVYEPSADWQNILLTSFRNWQNNLMPDANTEFIDQFHRRNLTQKLASLFDEII